MILGENPPTLNKTESTEAHEEPEKLKCSEYPESPGRYLLTADPLPASDTNALELVTIRILPAF